MAKSHAHCAGYQNGCLCESCRMRSSQLPQRLTENATTRQHIEALLGNGFQFIGHDEFDRPCFDLAGFGEVALYDQTEPSEAGV